MPSMERTRRSPQPDHDLGEQGSDGQRGQHVGNRHDADPQQPQAHPHQQQTTGRRERGDGRSDTRPPSRAASRVREPWTTSTTTAETVTPLPRLAANAIEANPSSVALSASWSMPRPRPSSSDPRIVSGPTQNTSEAVTHPSMKRSLAAWSVPPSRGTRAPPPGSRRPAPPGGPRPAVATRRSRRSAPTRARSAPGTRCRPRRAGPGRSRRPPAARHQQRDQAQTVGDHRAGVLAQTVPDQHPQAGAHEHCENVEEGPETGKQRGHRTTLGWWFNDHLPATHPGARGLGSGAREPVLPHGGASRRRTERPTTEVLCPGGRLTWCRWTGTTCGTSPVSG